MYDDLLGSRKEPPKKPKLKANLTSAPGAGAKPADPEKYPSHESARHRSVSSNSTEESEEVCDCEGDCEGHHDPGGVSPKDPWADVDEDDIEELIEAEDCEGDCENCSDEDCKSIEDQIEELFEGEDDDEIEPSQDIGC